MDAATNLTKAEYSNCKLDVAWQDSSSLQYQDCTTEISQSNARIYGNLQAIEVFAANNTFSNLAIQKHLGESIEDVKLGPYGSDGLEVAINHIKNESSISAAVVCYEINGCIETTRYIVIQLKMIEWGLFGLGEAMPGMFLAHHFSKIGQYFGDLDGNEWPHTPLHKDPKPLETSLNYYLMEITKELSGSKIKDISILDLPAFGSKVVQLEGDQKNEPNWPTEMNFAIYSKNMDNMTIVFNEYKTLLGHWNKYMEEISNNADLPNFTEDMKNNKYLNFTSYIKKDLGSFLKVISGTHLSASKNPNPLWKQTANKVFENTKDDSHVEKNGLHDKLIAGCAFKEDLGKKKFSAVDLQGGCDHFHPTLTTNGICHTFNGNELSEIWKPDELTAAFENVSKTKHVHTKEYFGGAGSVQGKKNLIK